MPPEDLKVSAGRLSVVWEILGIPAGETLMSVIAVGKAAVKPIRPPRKPVADVLKTA